jgi:hypothetical protein
VGQWHTLNGTQGAASCNAGVLLSYLSGQITQGQLHQSLVTKIDSKLTATDPAFVQMQQRVSESYGEWTVKIQSGNYVAGIGLMADANGENGVRSSFLVRADRFAIGQPGLAGIEYPFIVQNGRTYIGQALIGDAWITNAKIDNLAVNNAKIGWNAVTETVNYSRGAVDLGNSGPIWVTPDLWINFSQVYAFTVIAQAGFNSSFGQYLPPHANGSLTVHSGLQLYVDGAHLLRQSNDFRGIYFVNGSGSAITQWQEGHHQSTLVFSAVIGAGSWGTRRLNLKAFMFPHLRLGGEWRHMTELFVTIFLAKK